MMTSNDAAKFTRPSDREVVMTKVFDAPRELVWKAYTDARLIPRWWGPRYLTTRIDKMDVKPGGAWRFVSRARRQRVRVPRCLSRDREARAALMDFRIRRCARPRFGRHGDV
jgi:uncharacterized protein YndB with AHSA1/START domain